MITQENIQIRTAGVDEIIDLRHRILRHGFPRTTAIFAGDEAATAIHLAAVLDQAVIGCATLHRKSPDTYQLRGMAVDLNYQQHGIGSRLLREAERTSKENGATLIWANCRTPAVPFYAKHGWTIVGDEFIVETAGPHFKMEKRL